MLTDEEAFEKQRKDEDMFGQESLTNAHTIGEYRQKLKKNHNAFKSNIYGGRISVSPGDLGQVVNTLGKSDTTPKKETPFLSVPAKNPKFTKRGSVGQFALVSAVDDTVHSLGDAFKDTLLSGLGREPKETTEDRSQSESTLPKSQTNEQQNYADLRGKFQRKELLAPEILKQSGTFCRLKKPANLNKTLYDVSMISDKLHFITSASKPLVKSKKILKAMNRSAFDNALPQKKSRTFEVVSPP